MAIQAKAMLNTVAQALHISEDELLRQGVRTFLERQLRVVRAEVFEICSSYGVSGAVEMEAHYKDGTLEEAGSWQDLHRLDHLEYERDRLQQLLKTVL